MKSSEDFYTQDLPYRLGVGMMIINRQNQIFVGKRIDTKIEAWQMPQGGIDLGETPSRAVFREMEEEIGSSSGNIIAESKNWYSYDLPKFLIPKLWNGSYKGQKQKWFLIEFTGSDSDINLNNEHPEFEDWRWIDRESMSDLIIPFKKRLYQAVMLEFQPFLHKRS
ncbi:MAG: RNA pyrophosphohydrolase [Pseudomonadota bacterium]